MPNKRPNIIFIMSDDHAAHSMSCYGSRINRTPNLDRIAAGGDALRQLLLHELDLHAEPRRVCVRIVTLFRLSCRTRGLPAAPLALTAFPPVLVMEPVGDQGAHPEHIQGAIG